MATITKCVIPTRVVAFFSCPTKAPLRSRSAEAGAHNPAPLTYLSQLSIHIGHPNSKKARLSAFVKRCRSSVLTRKIRLDRRIGRNGLIAMPETCTEHHASRQTIPLGGEIAEKIFS